MDENKGNTKMEYIALAEGLNNRTLIPKDQSLSNYINKKPDKDFYISLYKYNQEHFKKFKDTKSLSGITDVTTDRLLFDFDDGTDVNKAKEDAIELVKRLVTKGVPQNQIGVFFSGGKGFHVEVKTKLEFNRKEFTNVVFNLAEDLKTYDPRIVDEQRIVRAPLTRHQDTGLFKIPLTVDQLTELPIETIKSMASSLDDVEVQLVDEWTQVDLPETIVNLKNKEVKKTSEDIILDEDLSFEKHQLSLKKCPKWLSPERYALQEGFFYGSESASAGERNDAFMILASTYKKNGINKSIAFNMLKATAELQSSRTGESIFPDHQLKRNVIDVVYSADWGGGIYAPDHPLLLTTRKRFDIPEPGKQNDFTSSSDMFSSFTDYASNIEGNTIKTGLPIDDYIRLTIGMPVALLGAPSSGKTTVSLNILRNTSKQGIHSLFFSMDMHKALVCQKQIHLLYNDSPSEIYKNVQIKDKADMYARGIESNFKNVSYITKAGLTVEDIRYYVEKKKEEVGDSLKLVMIDYLECIRGPYSDPTTNSAIIADGIKNIAVELDVCVILLVQPPKITGGAAFPLTNMYQIKGSSMVAQAMRSVIGIYREGFSPESPDKDNFITFVGLKNSMGSLFKSDCHWDGARGRIEVLDEIQKRELENLREKINAERATSDF